MKLAKFVLIFVIIISYIFLINILANLISISSNQGKITTENIFGGSDVKIGFSDSVSVTVIRKKHWWGRKIVNNGRENLHLFYFIKLPYKVKKFNFWIFHLIFLVILTLSIILISIKPKVYKEEPPNLDYEKNIQNIINPNY